MRRENDGEYEGNESVFHADHFLGWMVSVVMKTVDAVMRDDA